MSTTTTTNELPAAAGGRGRLRSLLTIVAVSAAALAFCRLNPWFDNAIKTLSTIIAVFLTVTALGAWGVTSPAMSSRWKKGLMIAYFAAIAAFGATTRAEYTGDLMMKLTPRQWVLNLLRRLGVDVGDVIHAARLADTSLEIISGDDVPQFLGPRGDARYTTKGFRLARDWSRQPPRELWRARTGKGWSSFAVVGDFAFTQEETTDFLQELVTCYGMDDGKLRWVHADPGGFESSLGGVGPRATPTFFEGKLLTVGGTGLLNCLDAATGRRLWSRHPLQESGGRLPDWGVSSSPLVFRSAKHGPLVVVSAGGNHGDSLHAYRLDDGQPVWKVGSDSTGYCTPQLRNLGGVEQIILVNWQAVTGHEPDTGAELWRYDAWAGSQPKVPQPIVLDDRRVLISAGYGVGAVMLDITRGDDGKWTVAEKWKSRKLKPKFTNLVVRDEHAYGLDDGEFLVCLDLATGDLKWRSVRGANYGHGQVLLIDDLLLVQSEAGDVALVAADPQKYHEFCRTTVLPSGISWNVPVLVGRRLLVRNDVEAALYELPTE